MNNDKYNKISIKNPSFDYYLFQSFEYCVVVYFGTKIILLNENDIYNIKFVVLLLVVYCFSCFWTKKMLLCDDKLEIVYPTRFILRKYSIAHNAIQKVVFTDRSKAGKRYVIYIKKSNRHYSIKSGMSNDIKKTIQYFRVKNVVLEYNLIIPKNKKEYIDERTTEL